MSPASSSVDSTPSRAEQRAREKARWAEWSALTDRLGVLWPNYGCFCGTLDDLRRTVADLERRAERDRPTRRSSGRTASADGDPQTTARLAVTCAQQRLQHGHHSTYESGLSEQGADGRGQLTCGDAGNEADAAVGGEVDG